MAVDLTQGHLLPRIQRVMDLLQQACPPLRFPADDSHSPEGVAQWLRGGTSASGQDMGDVRDANWFVGDKYLDAATAPWMIVWLPPLIGEERFVAGKGAAHLHPYADEAGGGDAAGALDEDGLGLAFRYVLARVCPVRAHLWASDFNDLDQLVHWVASCAWAASPGASEQFGISTVETGGLVPQRSGQRGLRYELRLNFVFPIVAPWAMPAGSGDAVQGNAVEVNEGRLV